MFDFEEIIDRRGRDALAIDGLGLIAEKSPDPPKEGFDFIPLWIADMNFKTPPAVTRYLEERIAHPLYGYFLPCRKYEEAILRWQQQRNHVEGLEAHHIGYENGILGGLLSAIGVMCSRGDTVLVNSPTYVGFTQSLSNAGYRVVDSPLQLDKNGVWRMDFADMEEKIKKHHIHAAVFCSPHNPCGRVWTRSEIEEMMALFEKHQVWVVSDEVWSDIIFKGPHVPTQSVNQYAREHTVALYGFAKTFNLAGLVGAYHIIYNDWLHDRVLQESSLSYYNKMNVLWMHAVIGAYDPESEAWVDGLNETLQQNAALAVAHIRKNFSGVQVAMPEGTYMLFLDCTAYCQARGVDMDALIKKGWEVGVGWQDGRPFKAPYGIRMNLALPTRRLEEALKRLDQYVFN